MVRVFRTVWILLVCVVFSFTLGKKAEAEPASLVFLNGASAAVNFNDGDSFRVLHGPHAGSRARLAGFNTLETHGPVHQWGGWHVKELYALSVMATLNARRGVWHCESKDMAVDGYGRVLWDCLDLAEDQIRNGFAHAMTVTEEPAHPRLVAAQHEAIRHRRGIWAKGVPTYVLTSVRSAAGGLGKSTYNRLVSTADGHSKKWYHDATLSECQMVCHRPTELTLRDGFEVVREMRANPPAQKTIYGIDDVLVVLSINTFLQNGMVPKIFRGKENDLLAILETMKKDGRFKKAKIVNGSCGVHVEFRRRYVRPKPACLKW